VFEVDRAERDAMVLGVSPQVAVTLDLVPRNMQRDRRRQAGVLVHLRRVRDLLERVAGNAGLRNTLKRVPELPNAHEGSSIFCSASRGAMAANPFIDGPSRSLTA
jgi:hypothetical protein